MTILALLGLVFSVDFGDDDETDSEEGDENPTPEGENSYLQFIPEDDVAAGSGDDTVVGCLGDDDIRGDLGADDIVGGGGTDEINCGDGADTFMQVHRSGDARLAAINDFDPDLESFVIQSDVIGSPLVFTDLADGSGSHIELEGVPIMYLVGVTAAQAQAADITLVPS